MFDRFLARVVAATGDSVVFDDLPAIANGLHRDVFVAARRDPTMGWLAHEDEEPDA